MKDVANANVTSLDRVAINAQLDLTTLAVDASIAFAWESLPHAQALRGIATQFAQPSIRLKHQSFNSSRATTNQNSLLHLCQLRIAKLSSEVLVPMTKLTTGVCPQGKSFDFPIEL